MAKTSQFGFKSLLILICSVFAAFGMLWAHAFSVVLGSIFCFGIVLFVDKIWPGIFAPSSRTIQLVFVRVASVLVLLAAIYGSSKVALTASVALRAAIRENPATKTDAMQIAQFRYGCFGFGWKDRVTYDINRVNGNWEIMLCVGNYPGGHRCLTVAPNGRTIEDLGGL